MVTVAIRDAIPQDAAALIALRKAIFGETDFMLYAPNEYVASAEELSAQLERIAASGHSRAILAQIEGTPAGFLGVNGWPVPRLRHSAQLVLGVLRAFWSRGVGRALLMEALNWAPGTVVR